MTSNHQLAFLLLQMVIPIYIYMQLFHKGHHLCYILQWCCFLITYNSVKKGYIELIKRDIPKFSVNFLINKPVPPQLNLNSTPRPSPFSAEVGTVSLCPCLWMKCPGTYGRPTQMPALWLKLFPQPGTHNRKNYNKPWLYSRSNEMIRIGIHVP